MKIFIQFLMLLGIINFLFIFFYNFLAKVFNVYDIPNETRKKHIGPVPLLGGLLFFFNFILFFIFEFIFNKKSFFYDLGLNSNWNIAIFLLSLSSIFLIGYIDDKIKLSAFKKFILLSLVSYVFFISNDKILINYLQVDLFGKTFDLFELSLIFSIFALVFYINIINMLDGINLISSIYFVHVSFILIILNFQINFAIFFLFCSAFFIFLNYKGKIFLGDSGSYSISFLLGLVIISLYESRQLDVEEVLLLMFLPVIDGLRLIFSRIYNKKSPFVPDRDHLHQILLDNFGFNKAIWFLSIFILIPTIYFYFNLIKPVYLILSMTFIYFFILNKFKKNK